NVIPGELGMPPDRPFTFDPTVLRAASASTGERKEQPAFISGPLPPAPADDAMPVDITALEEWTVADRMLGDMLRGMTPDDARQAEWRRGTLPPGQLGWRKATEIRDQAARLAAAALPQ